LTSFPVMDRLPPPPPLPALTSSVRARSTGHKPVPPAPRPLDLRRACSEPSRPTDASAQRFTDLLLQALTGDTAAPVSPKSMQLPTQIAFGEDPPPKSSAGPGQGACAVCLEELPETVQLCFSHSCTARFCPTCVAGFASEAVARALYAVPWLKCPACTSRIPTRAWAPHAEEAHHIYEANAEALLTFRCSDCHEVGSLLEGFQGGRLDNCSASLLKAWRDFCHASVPPEMVLNALDGHDIRQVLGCIADLERRTCLHLAWLRRDPLIQTSCCDTPFCFKCKVGTHHEGQTCEERQREELDILCQFCPECEVPTVRTEGCDHIVCVCGAEWTWQEIAEVGQAMGPAGHLRELLAKGALDPNWANPEGGRTLLMSVSMTGRRSNMQSLIEAAADVNLRDGNNRSAILYALGIANGNFYADAVDLLVENGATVQRADVAAWVSSSGASNPGAVRPLMRLFALSGTTDEVLQGTFGGSLLSHALRAGRRHVVRELLFNRRVSIARLAPFDFVAAQYNMSDFALFDKLLEASGLCIDERNESGQTLVQTAMARGRQELVRHLVLKCKASASFVDLARPAGFWPHMQVLPKDLWTSLIERGLDCWAPDKEGCDESRGWFLALLLRSGALGPDVVTRQPRRTFRQVPAVTRAWAVELSASMLHECWTPGAELFVHTSRAAELLAASTAVGAWAVAGRLIEARAGVDARDPRGGTPLHAAVAASRADLVSQLLAARADINAEQPAAASSGTGSGTGSGSSTGAADGGAPRAMTPLAIAEQAGWEPGVALLREAMARRAAESGDGSIENVGIRLSGEVQCPECRQRYDTERAMQIHFRFTHEMMRPPGEG